MYKPLALLALISAVSGALVQKQLSQQSLGGSGSGSLEASGTGSFGGSQPYGYGGLEGESNLGASGNFEGEGDED